MAKKGGTQDKRLTEIMEYCLQNGEQDTLDKFGLSSETLNRYKRRYKEQIDPDFNIKKLLLEIGDKYTDKELKAIAMGARLTPGYAKVPVIDFDGEEITFGFMTDTHAGSKYFKEEYFHQALEEFRKENCEFIVHTGDLVEGMSNRAGHIYELTHLGYHDQKNYGQELLEAWEGDWYIIDGNHDRWFEKSAGALIVKDIADHVPNVHFLGHDEGDISLRGNIVVKLWHGEDSSSYASSYRVQKLIEAFTGGQKPHVLLCGHTHKQGYFFERHIHAVSGGALCTQSNWMRRTRKANHTGFWIIKLTVNKIGVAKFQPTWYPFYA